MRERATPVLRWLRALVLATVAFSLGLVAHLSAGGLLPGPVGLATLFGIVLVGSAALLGYAAGTLRITALVVLGQSFIHAGLTAGAGHTGDTDGSRPRPLATHDVPAAAWDRRGSLYDLYTRRLPAGDDGDQVVVPDWLQHLVDDLTGPHAAMAVAHLLSATLVGLWLASGERALWALVRLSRAALGDRVREAFSLLAAVLAVGPRRSAYVPAGTPVRRLHSALLATTHARRGPPALLAA